MVYTSLMYKGRVTEKSIESEAYGCIVESFEQRFLVKPNCTCTICNVTDWTWSYTTPPQYLVTYT